MIFAQPLLLWLLLALLPLGWWLATGAKPPRRRAPSLAFWPRELAEVPTRRRRRVPLHAWLALLSAALVIAALAGPALVSERPLALRIWLDRSASMSARSAAGSTRLEDARALLTRALAAEPRETPCELWIWPAAELVARGSASEIERALAGVEARSLAGDEDGPSASELGAGRLWWVGDRAPEELPSGAAFLAVGDALRRNAGWVSASFIARRELWLVAACEGTERATLEVRAEPGARVLESFSLEPGDRRAVRVALDPSWRALRLVAAEGADDLPLDDEIALRPDAQPIAVATRDLPPELQRAFAADERLALGAASPAELLIDGALRRAAEDPRVALRFGAGAGDAALETLRWEDAERDALWRRLAPPPWSLRGLDAGRSLARASSSGRSAIALDGTELLCALDAAELVRSAAARAELPLLCALLIDECVALLRDPVLDRARSAPLDLGESSASARGSAREETQDGRREREPHPLGRWLALAAAVAWIAACAMRTWSAR